MFESLEQTVETPKWIDGYSHERRCNDTEKVASEYVQPVSVWLIFTQNADENYRSIIQWIIYRCILHISNCNLILILFILNSIIYLTR